MSKSKKPEFIKQDPSKLHRHPVLEILRILLPVLIVFIGGQIAAQYWAHAVGFKRFYTDVPWYITKHKWFGLDSGYPLFNFFLILLTIAANPFDPVVDTYVLNFMVPFGITCVTAVVTFLIIGVLMQNKNKNRHVYDTGRWGDEKDLKKFGLCMEQGVVMGEQVKADVTFEINPETNGLSLKLLKPAPLVCHAGGTNTLLIAPTRAGKGVSCINTTLVSYPTSMIVFDPKGELYNMTAGFRAKFTRVLKFSPINDITVGFNPLEEVELTKQAFADIGLILANVFEEPKGGQDGTNQFFDNAAQTLLTALIFHMLSSGKYPKEKQNMAGCLEILSEASGIKKDPVTGQDCALGDVLLNEMINSPHFDREGNESDYISQTIKDGANQILAMHEKVRSDTFSTVFTKMRLFADPYIKNCTSHSDFRIQDFYDSPEPITLYLTVPFSHIDRVAPVFKLIVNFLLRKFSAGEMLPKGIEGVEERKLKNRLLFMLDEFPVLGCLPFLSKTMGILAGYGINFFIVVQMLSQIYDLYGQHQAFLDNCDTVGIMAPGNIDDASKFSQMLGKESVVNASQSVSGSKYALDLSNVNQSVQDIQRDLMSPSEIMHMGKEYILIFKQGMAPYLAKKCVCYMDERFKHKLFYQDKKTGEALSGWLAPYTKKEIQEIVSNLPSQQKKEGKKAVWEVVRDAAKKWTDEHPELAQAFTGENGEEEVENQITETYTADDEEDERQFNLDDYLETYDPDSEKWDGPTKMTEERREPPPAVAKFTAADFNKMDG